MTSPPDLIQSWESGQGGDRQQHDGVRGAIYEQTTSGGNITITKYYQAGGQRIALRVNGVVRWLATDHLGSTAVTANETGARIAELRYKPWGENRYTFGATPTQRRFTGQVLDEVAGGLYFYNARYYDPALGRFIQADTLIPNPGNPQSLNRYSYSANNPLRFVDPSGHYECEDDNDCQIPKRPPRRRVFPDRDLTQFAVAQAQFMAQSPVTGWLAFENAHLAQTGNPGFKASAYLTFQGLVGDGKRWDFKDVMQDELGESFLLCSPSRCYWFEYSVLGNILYGYVGTQAGFAEWELRLGAGYAEARDPENSAKRNWPAIHPIAYLPAERHDYWYDDPYDYAAVSMGIELSGRHGGHVTLQAFQALVAKYHDSLAAGTPNYDPVRGSGAPYGIGHFDNRPR